MSIGANTYLQKFKISVIIPVYNAGSRVGIAVESALMQPEVDEVLLIEDGSNDNSLNVCYELANKFNKVKICFHHANSNKGAAASRNLGIKKAANDFIAFLDADDYYLHNRFAVEKGLFLTDHTIEGVYSFVKAEFKSNELKQKYLLRHAENETFSEKLNPDELLFYLLFGGKGSFHINGVTLKKSVFQRVGYFDYNLRLAEDTHMWLRLAGLCKLFPGNIETPIAIRTVHENNTVHASDEVVGHYNKLLFEKLIIWAIRQRQISFKRTNWFFIAYCRCVAKAQHSLIPVLLRLAWQNPTLLLHAFLYRKTYAILKDQIKQSAIQRTYTNTN